MQQFILIPEIPVIIRKIAPDGNHCAYWEHSSWSRRCAADWLERLNAGDRESLLRWSTHNIHPGQKSINLTFKESSNV